MHLVIDGLKLIDKSSAHTTLRTHLDIDLYQADNLDSLFEALLSVDYPLGIMLVNTDKMLANLGDYGEKLLKVFTAAHEVNEHIDFNYI